MLHRYISVLILLVGNVAAQPVSVDEVREALETEGVVPRGRFSFEEAREALEAACRSPLSPTHEALCSSDRGLWYQLQGQFTQAEAQYVRAVSGFEKAPVVNQRLLATALHNLGATYRELRRLEDAKQVLSRALALRQEAYGDDHPLTASTLGQLGTIHLAAGELTRAEVLLQSAVSTHERLLPPTHPDRVSIVHNLAQLRIAQNDYTSATKLLQGLVAPLNGTGEPPSLVHAAPYQTLAALYRRLGQYARALPLLKKAQRLYEDSFGPDDLTAALVRVEFGLLSAAEGKNHLAKTQLRETHARLVKILGAHHPQVASVENNLAVVCLHLGDLDEAAVLLEQAMQTLRRADDAPERELGTYLINMAEVRRRQGKLQDCEAHLKEALDLFERTLPPDSPEMLAVLEQYATVLKSRRSPDVQSRIGSAPPTRDDRDTGGTLLRRNRKPVLLVATALATTAVLYSQAQPQRYIEHVKYLASPELQGRGAGTEGLERASNYIADQFKTLGLQPAGQNGSYWQSFKVTTSAKPARDNRLAEAKSASSLRLTTDYIPLSFSSNGQVTAPVVFAGYVITAPEFHYDDYTHLDVKDKIVLVLRYEPKRFRKDPSGKERAHTHHAHLVSKAINARNHGAKAVILLNGESEAKQDALIRFGSVSGPENSGILMVQVKNSIGNEWLARAGKSLSEAQRHIEEKSEPNSFALPESVQLALQVDISREQSSVRNVLGYLPGKTKEYIVIGAHYDHLGLGNESSLAPSQIGKVHPGADDNASGTAGLLELARLFSAKKNDLARGVLFMAFAGEEIGLLGSAEWVNQPTQPLQNAAAMINMDMIGRVNGSKLYIGGTGTGSTFEPILKEITKKYDFKIDFSKDGYSSSDHTSFAAKSVPVLFFFSGLHGDYHKPSDTWEKISGPASAQVVNLIYDVAMNLVTAESRPQFVKVAAAAKPGGGGGGGYGPYFGSVPDFAPIEKGVKFSDVRPGSPAAKAGLKGGDILIQFGDKPINNLYDFTFALRNSKVGDVVNVKFVRDGKEMSAPVTLEARQ